jgi:predicted dehydrogenase
MEKLRLGIVGCGGIASTHAKGFSEISDDFVVTAMCDIHLDRAKAAAEAAGAKVAVADYRDMTDHVDCILASLPHDLHYEVGMHFLNHGKHVMLEKPMCNTEAQARDLIETAERNGLILMTAYHNRYRPAMQLIKRLIDEKKYGDVFQMSFWTEQYTKYAQGHWALDSKRLGGGQFFSHGCHYIDLMLWLMGKPVSGFHLGTNFGTPWMEQEGTSNASIQFDNGALGYHFGTWGARGTRLGWSMHIHCMEGMLEYKRGEGKLFLHHRIVGETRGETANQARPSQLELIYEEPGTGKMTQFQFLHFADCIRNGKAPLTGGPSSLQGLRVIWRLYEAERKQTMADLRGLGVEEDWRDPRAVTTFSGLDL